jgi:hypothetical protein
MVHELSQYAFELPAIEDWLAGDDRTLAFKVVDQDGTGVDISTATVRWRLFQKEYETDAADAVLDGSDANVELVTDSRVDTSVGEWEVRVDGAATDGKWGTFTHRPEVEDSEGGVASWRGEIDLSA